MKRCLREDMMSFYYKLYNLFNEHDNDIAVYGVLKKHKKIGQLKNYKFFYLVMKYYMA